MKASLKGKYAADKTTGIGSLAFNAGDLKLRASLTDATFVAGPTLSGLSLALEKPGSFLVEYNVPKKDFRFQFINTVRIADKPLNFTYIHNRGDNRTIVDGSFSFDPANKLSANYMLGSNNCKLKYTYAHQGIGTFEPCYDLAKNSWDFALSRKIIAGDLLKATYQTSTKMLAVEWSTNSKSTASFKVCASVNLAEEVKMPKLTAETTWNLEM